MKMRDKDAKELGDGHLCADAPKARNSTKLPIRRSFSLAPSFYVEPIGSTFCIPVSLNNS
jgi:hypothetical protein